MRNNNMLHELNTLQKVGGGGLKSLNNGLYATLKGGAR